MKKLSDLPNIGKILEEKLCDIGIRTPEELLEVGSKKAFEHIKFKDNGVCLNMLCALEGAVRDIRWHYLPDEIKSDLKEFYNSLKL